MMPKTTSSLILLNFDNSSNLLKDECGNKWLFFNSNYSFMYDKEIIDNVVAFDNGGMYKSSALTFGGYNFTIDGLIYLTKYTYGARIFHFNNPSNMQFLIRSDNGTGCILELGCGKVLIQSTYNIPYKTWFHFAITYNYSTNIFSLFINGTKQLKSTSVYSPTSKFTSQSFADAHIFSHPTYATYHPTGKLAFFRLEKGLLFNSNFDYQTTIVKPNMMIIKNNYNITTKRNIYHLYNISYDSLYNYNINDSLLYNNTYRNIHNKVLYNNDTYRDINKINEYNNTVYRSILKNYIYNNDTYCNIYNKALYNNDTYRDINKINSYNNDIYRSILKNYIYNNDTYCNIYNKALYNNDTYRDILNNITPIYNTLRNVLYNINPLYNTYRYIKRIDKYKNITKRNIKHDYINILHNTKRLIHNNINIINYIYRKKVFSNNINNDTIRSVISWKHKIITFIINPRYRLK